VFDLMHGCFLLVKRNSGADRMFRVAYSATTNSTSTLWPSSVAGRRGSREPPFSVAHLQRPRV